MILSEAKRLRMIEKFRSNKFYHWKVLLVSFDLWNIININEELPSIHYNMKKKKEYQYSKQKVFRLFAINIDKFKFFHIITHKRKRKK